MTAPPNPDAPRLKREIVGRVGEGERVRAVCRGAGMPHANTVLAWRRADANFAAEMTAALARGRFRRMCSYDDAKAAAFLARARAGETIASLIGGRGMLSQRVYVHWRRTQPPFAEAINALRARRDAQFAASGRARRRAFDQGLADRLLVRLQREPPGARSLAAVLKADPELPSWVTLRRWRRENPAFEEELRVTLMVRRRRVVVSDERLEGVVRHIILGGSFKSYSRLPGAPSPGSLRRWMADPRFADEVARACVSREDWYRDQIDMMVDDMPMATVQQLEQATAPLRRRLGALRNRPKPPRQRSPRPRLDSGQRVGTGVSPR